MQIFIYPVKSLRGVSVSEATITKYGFLYDRCYMLVKEDSSTPDVKNKHGSMLIGLIPEMALFTTSIQYPSEEGDGEITVTFHSPGSEETNITLPLQPDTTGLGRLDVDLHGSKASAYNMGFKYNQWFSDCFGYAVKLAAVGEQERDILFPGSPYQQVSKSSWLSGITKSLPFLGNLAGNDEPRLKFQDCAPFLVVSQKSCQTVSDQLPDGEQFDIRKTRPNIVVSGQEAWEEDFWAEITINEVGKQVKIPLQHNCLRCQSLNVDFATGKYSETKNGQVLRLLQKDRRVDMIKKYNAVFGRYGFITPSSMGKEIQVGDVVEVTQRSTQRSGFGMTLYLLISFGS
jgi:uncharacterized protein YcbX